MNKNEIINSTKVIFFSTCINMIKTIYHENRLLGLLKIMNL